MSCVDAGAVLLALGGWGSLGFTFWAKDFPYQRERQGESTDGLGPSMIKQNNKNEITMTYSDIHIYNEIYIYIIYICTSFSENLSSIKNY